MKQKHSLPVNRFSFFPLAPSTFVVPLVNSSEIYLLLIITARCFHDVLEIDQTFSRVTSHCDSVNRDQSSLFEIKLVYNPSAKTDARKVGVARKISPLRRNKVEDGLNVNQFLSVNVVLFLHRFYGASESIERSFPGYPPPRSVCRSFQFARVLFRYRRVRFLRILLSIFTVSSFFVSLFKLKPITLAQLPIPTRMMSLVPYRLSEKDVRPWEGHALVVCITVLRYYLLSRPLCYLLFSLAVSKRPTSQRSTLETTAYNILYVCERFRLFRLFFFFVFFLYFLFLRNLALSLNDRVGTHVSLASKLINSHTHTHTHVGEWKENRT